MAVQVFGVVFGDVERRLKPFVFDGDSDPTSTEVTTIISEVAGDVNGELEGLGFTPAAITVGAAPVSYKIIARVIADLAAAETYRAFSVHDPERAAQLDRSAQARLNGMVRRPEKLSDAFSPTSNPGTFRSHLDDSQLDLPKDDDAGAGSRFKVGDSNRRGMTRF